MKKSCIRCEKFMACKDPRKTITFYCERFTVTQKSLHQEKVLLEDLMEAPFATSTLRPELVFEDPNSAGAVNVSEILNTVLKDRRIVSPDIKIPEGDFPEAPNFHTWCVSDQFLNQKPFIMQTLISTKLFAEYCPRCSDVDWMDNGVRVKDSLGKFVEKVALLEHSKCPYCGVTKLQLFRSGELNPYNELALSAGQRSGKSAMFGMQASYLTHRMIKLEKPNEVFGLLKANVLQATFVALTAAQAKDTLWEPFYGHLLEAPWFQNYHKMLTDIEYSHGGEGSILKLKDTFVYYKHRRITAYPAGPDKRILRGRTRYLSGIDELGWFNNSLATQSQVKMNANEVYIALERSLLTVRSQATSVVKQGFYNVPFGYFINISSPSSVRDKIMELVRKGQGSKKLLGICLPTWKVNPHVPKSALSEEFRKDPDTAMRDYGAQPPLTNSPFIPSKEKIEPCLSTKKHTLKVSYRTKTSKDKTSTELFGELIELSESGKPAVLALDAGFSNNSFAFAIGHLANNGYPIISIVGEIIPTPGSRINHSLLYENLLSDLMGTRNIVLVCADRWNSLKILADMEQDFDVEKRQYSLKYVDMQLFKSYMEDKQLLLPKPTKPIAELIKYDHSNYPACFKHFPVDHLMLQLLTVQDTGSAILKGDGLTDDILRAVMLCFRMLVDEDNAELLSQEDAPVEGMRDLASMMVSKLYSGGGSGSSGAGMSGNSNLGVLKQRS